MVSNSCPDLSGLIDILYWMHYLRSTCVRFLDMDDDCDSNVGFSCCSQIYSGLPQDKLHSKLPGI